MTDADGKTFVCLLLSSCDTERCSILANSAPSWEYFLRHCRQLGRICPGVRYSKIPCPFLMKRLHQHRLVHFVMLRYTSVLAKSGDKIQDLSPRDAIMTLMHPHYLSIKICCSDGWQNICASMAAEM